MHAMHAAHEQQRRDDLRIILRLRPDQEPALAALMAASHPPGPPPGGHLAPMPQAMTTPERLDAMARREGEMAARRQQHLEAMRTFYAALDPEQRRVFDALERMHGPHPMAHIRQMHGPGGGFAHPPAGPPPHD
jgi:hypothetical protein